MSQIWTTLRDYIHQKNLHSEGMQCWLVHETPDWSKQFGCLVKKFLSLVQRIRLTKDQLDWSKQVFDNPKKLFDFSIYSRNIFLGLWWKCHQNVFLLRLWWKCHLWEYFSSRTWWKCYYVWEIFLHRLWRKCCHFENAFLWLWNFTMDRNISKHWFGISNLCDIL